MPRFQSRGRFFDQLNQTRKPGSLFFRASLEPRVPVGGVVDDQIDDDLYAVGVAWRMNSTKSPPDAKAGSTPK